MGKKRIDKYKFIENQDYVQVAQSGVGGFTGFKPIEYLLSVDMAKEICMLEANEIKRHSMTGYLNLPYFIFGNFDKVTQITTKDSTP